MNKIGIWNTAFLGDAVLTLPLLRTMRMNYPGAEIHFWVRRGVGSLFAAQPEIDVVHEFDKRGDQRGPLAMYALGRELAKQGYSLWLSAHASFRSALMARWSSARVRIGYGRPWYNRWFYTHTVERGFGEEHEIGRLLRLARPLGISRTFGWPEIVHAAPVLDKARDLRALWGGGPVIGVHPGSVWPTKRWPAAYYGRLVAEAAGQGVKTVVFAGPGEEAQAREVIETAGEDLVRRGAVVDLSNALSLPELSAVIGRLDCYVTNDSGPMHLAWAQRVPVVAMFGPTVEQWGFFPRGEGATVMQRAMACRPCGLHGGRECPQGHHRCMTDISPEAVWAEVCRKLDGAGFTVGGRELGMSEKKERLPERWVAVRLSAMGDVVLTTGVLDFWWRTRGMRFVVVTRRAFAPVFEGHPAVDEIVALGESDLKGRGWLRTSTVLARKYRDCGLLDLHVTPRTRLLSMMWRGPVRRYSKFSVERRVLLRTGSAAARATLERTNVPQRYSLAFEEKPPVRSDLVPHLFVSEEERVRAREILAAIGCTDGPVAALHPYATHPGKLWPEAYWRSLVGALDSVGIAWFVVGRGEPLFDRESDLTNDTSLRETCALLEAADVLVTGDSGPMHIACGVGTPVVALFGPTDAAWGFYPSGERDVVLESAMGCRPCSLHGKVECPEDGRCMRDIGPEKVLAEALARLVKRAR